VRPYRGGVWWLSAYVVFAGLSCAVLAARGQEWWIGLALGVFGPIGLVLAIVVAARAGRVEPPPPPPPGARWEVDPTRRHEHRLWDGVRWTGHVSDRGVSGWDPLPLPPPGVER